MCSFDERGVRKLTIDSKKPFSVIFVVFSGGTVSAVDGAVEGGGESEDEAIVQGAIAAVGELWTTQMPVVGASAARLRAPSQSSLRAQRARCGVRGWLAVPTVSASIRSLTLAALTPSGTAAAPRAAGR